MDYLKIYNHFHQKANTITKRIVIAEMKKAKAKKRPFNTTHNIISNKLFDYFKKNYSDRLLSDFNEAYKIFQNRYEFYSGTDKEVISLVLKEEVKDVFTDNNTVHDYRAFIIDLAVESSLKESHRHFNNYRDFYELIYDLDKYEYFYFNDFEIKGYRSSKEFNEMMDIRYPYRIEEREALKSEVQEATKNINQETIVSEPKKNEKGTSSLDLFSNFTDDEKFLILNILFYKEDLVIGMVEYMKLIRIVGSYEDVSIFDNSPKNSASYAKVNKGIDYYSSIKNKRELLTSVKNKLNTLMLKSMVPTLNLMLLHCK